MEHDTAASKYADAYIKGDAEERASIARECEEQGILAALVAGRLRPAGLEEEFIGAMVRSVGGGRGR
jgi:hypothetical protein